MAQDCWLSSRTIRPIPQLKEVLIGLGAGVRTIYRFSPTQWFAWPDDVDAVPSPVVGDNVRRTMWTGDGEPKMTTTTIMGAFVGPGVPVSRRLGIPAPDTAPLVGLVALPDVSLPTELVRTSGVSYGSAQNFFAAATRPAAVDALEAYAAANDAWRVEYEGDVSLHVQIAYRDGREIKRENLYLDSGNWVVTGNVITDTSEAEADEVHAWIYTWVSDLGEEGPPSEPSDLLTRSYTEAGAIQSVTINTETGVTGPYGISTKRIYRTLTGISGATSYQLVAEIPAVQANFTDDVLGSALGGDIISTLWDPPPDDLEGLIALPNGVCAGFSGRDIYFSEPYQPHAWPRDYIQALDSDVVGLGAYGTTLVAGTKGVPYAAVGTDPATLRMVRSELNQACVAKRSFARAARQGVVYAAPEGLVLVGPGGAQIVSLPAYDFEGWQILGPEDLQAFYLDGNYVGFLADSAIAFDQESRSVISYADDIVCGYEDQENDRLYVVVGNRIMEWSVVREPGDMLRAFRWRGRLETGGLRAYNTAQVIADDYPVFLKLIGDGADLEWPVAVQLTDQTVFEVADRLPFRLPPDFGLHGDWELELTGSHEIREVRIGTMDEMLG